MLQNVRFALRQIASDRWFAAAVIVALALGIGVNATGFAIINAAFLRGVPLEDADRLYMLWWQNRSGRRSDVSFAELADWRAASRTFAGLAAFTDAPMNLSDDRAVPEQARGALITANAFAVLGQQPLLGRDFAIGDDRLGSSPVIIGESIWRRRYGGDPDVLGASVRVNGRPATIIGVMPDRMKFPDNTEIWAPLVPTEGQDERTARSLSVFGRLTDTVSRRQAQAEMTGIAGQLAVAYPDANRDLLGIRVETLTASFVGGSARRLFVTIMVAAGIVLLIACANVANLLLARAAVRAREIALRMALGATRARVVQQLLLENVVLGVIGGGIGLLLASGGVRIFDAAMRNSGAPYWIVFTLDYMVFGYVAGICVLTAILSGLAPALHISKANSHDMLKEGGRGRAGSRRARWFSGTMVVAELALTLVLLAGGGLLAQSFLKLYTVDLGIDIDNLMTMGLPLPESKYPTPESRRVFVDRLESRLAGIPGVESFAMTTGVPPVDGGERLLEIDSAVGNAHSPRFVSTVTISPRFFDAVGVALIRGRTFHDSDGAPGAETVIINQRLAAQFFPGEDPIGRRLRFVRRVNDRIVPDAPAPPASAWRTVVGISPTIRQGSAQDAYLSAVVYIPYRQDSPGNASVLIHSPLPPAAVIDAVRREVQAVDPDQPVFAIKTIAQLLAEDRWLQRTFGSMFAVFAVIALVLSSVGLYAVMAYSVAQRTQEIGIRMAIGAQQVDVLWLIVKRGLVQLTIGLPLGLAGALALGVALQRMLVEITPGDPATFAGITALLAAVSAAACLLPARRAARIDPMVALRTE